jgi:hypothetical protein
MRNYNTIIAKHVIKLPIFLIARLSLESQLSFRLYQDVFYQNKNYSHDLVSCEDLLVALFGSFLSSSHCSSKPACPLICSYPRSICLFTCLCSRFFALSLYMGVMNTLENFQYKIIKYYNST